MPKTIKMPPEGELPRGPRREFAEALYRLYRDAGRPALHRVSERVAELPLPGSASKETIRKMLTGRTVPLQWFNAEAVFVALSDMAKLDPDRLVYLDDGYERQVEQPARQLFMQLWKNAFDEHELLYEEMQTYEPSRAKGAGGFSGGFSDEPPWAKGTGGFSDEPPF